MQDDLPMPFSPPSGLPQHSKLATYMARSASTPLPLLQSRPVSSPSSSLGQVFTKPHMDTPPPAAIDACSASTPLPLLQSRPVSSPSSSLGQVFTKPHMDTPPPAAIDPRNASIPTLPLQSRHMSTPMTILGQAFAKLSVASPSAGSEIVVSEFVPHHYSTPRQLLSDSQVADSPTKPTHQIHQENVGGTTYFYTNSVSQDSLAHSTLNSSRNSTLSASINSSHNSSLTSTSSSLMTTVADAPCLRTASGASPYASQMYAPPHMNPATATGPASKQGLAAAYYTPETIREEIHERNADVFLQNYRQQYLDLPVNVEIYTDLRPLEPASAHAISTCFRVTHRESGHHFALRRLHGYAGAPSNVMLDAWRMVNHPSVVRFHTAFTTNAFGDHSMVLVYDYHPACATMKSKYMTGGGSGGAPDCGPFSDPDAPRPYSHQKNALLRAVACGAMLPESELWSLLVQLTGALRAVHHSGLACRNLDATKVVMNGCRLRLSWCGAPDAQRVHQGDMAQAQQDDMTALGRLALALAARNLPADNLSAALELVARSYSADLNNLIVYLLSTQARRTITDLMPMIGARYYTQVEVLQRRADELEQQLAREIDNGRLLRILVKLGMVVERPELNMDPAWSETGDRYMLKLFRDYLFHSVTEDGRPWLDMAHITDTLNQLDGGSETMVLLASRDEESALIVTYAELKRFFEQAFEDVLQSGQGSGP